MEALSSYLTERDTQIRISENTEVKRIQNAIENTLRLILNLVQAKDPRLAGRLLKIGSYFSELKIGLPDEFDFLYELNSLKEDIDFAVMPSGFKGKKNLWRTPEGDIVKKKVYLRKPEKVSIIAEEQEEEANVKWLHKAGSKGEFVLDQIGVKNTLYFAIMEAIKELNPSQFHRSLELDLSEEGTFMNGPAITLFFIWKGRKYRNLKISVDVTVALKAASKWQEYFDFFKANNKANNSFLGSITAKEISQHGYHLVPSISDRGHVQWKISTSFLETQICSRFSRNSTFKQLIRVLKSLKDEHLKLAPSLDLLKHEEVASILRFCRFYFGEEFNNSHHLVSSYVIKTAVFALCNFATLPEWRNASLGTLYLLAIVTLYNYLSTGILNNVFISKQKLKLPEFGDILPGLHRIFQETNNILSTPAKSKQSKKNSTEEVSWEKLENNPFRNADVIFQLVKKQVDEHFSSLWQIEQS